MKTRFLITAATFLVATSLQAASTGDDFNDNKVDVKKWGPDEKIGHGVLTEKNQRLEYTCTGGTSDDDLIRRWRAGDGPYNADWEMQMDLFNNTTFTLGSIDQNNSFGIKLRGPTDDDQEIYVELYNSQLQGPPARKGFDAAFESPGLPDLYVDSFTAAGTTGAVRMAFNSLTKVVSVYYDADPTDGYQWVQFASFGVAGIGGADDNADWGMGDASRFRIYIYGYSTKMNVTSGQMYGDNFQTTGLVTGVPDVHDLAVTKITAPKVVILKSDGPAVTKRVNVTVQNRSTHSETLTTSAQLSNLVTLVVESLHPGDCDSILPVLHSGLPQKSVPFTLKSKQKFNVVFDVTFGCAGDATKGAGHEDFRYIATVHHDVIDGIADAHSECDVCPRAPLEGGKDPNPNGRIVDKGCGAPAGHGTFGNPVLTDVVVKER
jgi:hypothetical protein